MATLTDDIKLVFAKAAELSKNYTNTKIQEKIEDAIEKYSQDIGASAEELKEYIKALDSLDFANDGTLDASVVTQKIASNEAAIISLKNTLSTVSEKLDTTSLSLDSFKISTGTKIAQVESTISDISTEVEAIRESISEISSSTDELISSKVGEIDDKTQIDVDAVNSYLETLY